MLQRNKHLSAGGLYTDNATNFCMPASVHADRHTGETEMKRTTLSLCMLALAIPTGAMAAASSDEPARVCPKGRPAVTIVQEAEAPATTGQVTATAKASNPHPASTTGIRNPSQRWQSLLPGMIR